MMAMVTVVLALVRGGLVAAGMVRTARVAMIGVANARKARVV